MSDVESIRCDLVAHEAELATARAAADRSRLMLHRATLAHDRAIARRTHLVCEVERLKGALRLRRREVAA